MVIKVEERNGNKVVVIPKEYELPWYLEKPTLYKVTIDEQGNYIVPCRPCTVTIIKPVVQRSPMGMIQTQQTIYDNVTYFDIPEKSLLVEVGDDLTEELQLKLKEQPKLEGEVNENK